MVQEWRVDGWHDANDKILAAQHKYARAAVAALEMASLLADASAAMAAAWAEPPMPGGCRQAHRAGEDVLARWYGVRSLTQAGQADAVAAGEAIDALVIKLIRGD